MLVAAMAFGCASDAAHEPADGQKGADLSCPGEPLSPAPLRRLTRFEYQNAISDVFGNTLPMEDLFPRDEVALGFDNQAGTLGTTDLHVEGYLEAATTLAEWRVAEPARLAGISGCGEESPECLEALADALGRRLLRRPLTRAELDRYLEAAGDATSPEGFSEGAVRVVAALLQNPEFLYRLERASNDSWDGSSQPFASPYVLASRLSFLFWGSVPDPSLLDAAASNTLATRADVEREARRLVADERAKRGLLHFYLQWLKLSDFALVEKDRVLFTRWDDSLRDELGRETTRFLEAILWEDDARFETLMTAPYTFANAVLSDFYALPIGNPDQTELTRKDFGAGVPRRGLLTQASILSTQAKANQTDPIHRGKFIRTQFFCTEPQPPPPDLVVSPPVLDPRKSTRERFEQHRADDSCAGCHDQLDPVGLLFEHYDAIGRYRDTENGVPVDATGYLSDTDIFDPIDGVPELAERLAESTQVRQCVIKQWFRYTFGRGETEADACTLDKLEDVFLKTNGDLNELLVALTQTDPFLYATPAPETLDEGP
ncbi:MAG TPA: DUF1592 domain-containing protein [Polyangiaceae bacterium]|nr:DUF1592 domain-containing protein [Polyangiaceae bacterium]